jgi:hypothetical protein
VGWIDQPDEADAALAAAKAKSTGASARAIPGGRRCAAQPRPLPAIRASSADVAQTAIAAGVAIGFRA